MKKLNLFYYLDSIHLISDYSLIFYKIETDLSLEDLLKFFQNKALQYCEENYINPSDFLEFANSDYDDDYPLEIEIEGLTRGFSLRTCLDLNALEHKISKKLEVDTLKILSEHII